MFRYIQLISVLVSILFLSGCSSVNNLTKYNLKGKSIQFTSKVSKGAFRIRLFANTSGSSLPINVDAIKAKTYREDFKVQKSVDIYKVADLISFGLKDALSENLNMDVVNRDDNKPEYIAQTTLRRFSVLAGDHEVSVFLDIDMEIVDNSTDKIVWKNQFIRKLPIDQISIRENGSLTTMRIFNINQLEKLDEKDIVSVFENIASDAGLYIGRIFTDDFTVVNNYPNNLN